MAIGITDNYPAPPTEEIMGKESKGPIPWAGPALIAIGILHTVVMVGMFHQTYQEILAF